MAVLDDYGQGDLPDGETRGGAVAGEVPEDEPDGEGEESALPERVGKGAGEWFGQSSRGPLSSSRRGESSAWKR